jgi:hypothetical protein
MNALKLSVLAGIVLGGLLAFFFVADLSAHDDRLISVSFLAGVMVALLVPRIWRWADRD